MTPRLTRASLSRLGVRLPEGGAAASSVPKAGRTGRKPGKGGPKVGKRGKASYSEFAEQSAFAQRLLLDRRTRDLPWTSMLTGANLTMIQASLAKRKGVRRGVPDWLLFAAGCEVMPTAISGGTNYLPPVRRAAYAARKIGLAIEFKRATNRKGGSKPSATSPEQRQWEAQLAANGWRVESVTSAEDAWRIVSDYLDFRDQ